MKKINKIEMTVEEYDDLEMDLKAKMIDEVLEENSTAGRFPLGQYIVVSLATLGVMSLAPKVLTVETYPIITGFIMFVLISMMILFFAHMVNIYKQITAWGKSK